MRYSTNLNLVLYDVGDKWNHENWNSNMEVLDTLLTDIHDRTSEINNETASFSTSVTAPNFIGNASSASKLETAREITIGTQTISFDGSTNISFDLTSLGAADRVHTHPYLPLAGGTMTGQLNINTGSNWNQIRLYSPSNYERSISVTDNVIRIGAYTGTETTNRRYFQLRSAITADVKDGLQYGDITDGVETIHTVLHSGNYTDYVVGKTGGQMSGALLLGDYDGEHIDFFSASGKKCGFDMFDQYSTWFIYNSAGNEFRRIELMAPDVDSDPATTIRFLNKSGNELYYLLHSGNYTNYAVAANGGTLSNGTLWESHFTGNAYFPSGFNFKLVGADNGEYSIDLQNESNTGMFFHIWSQTKSSILQCNADTGLTTVYYTLQCNSNATIAAGLSVTGNINCTGSVYNAVWNDYAEYYERGEKTEPGDIIALDISSEEERYIKATSSDMVCGIHSDTYGHIVGGESVPEDYNGTFQDYNNDSYIPVGLNGRVKTKIIGPVKKGDFIVVSEIPGVGRKYNPETDERYHIIGFVTETNLQEDIKRVKMQLKTQG